MLRLIPLVLLAGCGVERALPLTNTGGLGDGGGGDMAIGGPFDMKGVPFDMKTTLVDLAKPADFGGVACGGATCNASQECCVSASGSMTCVGKGTCNRDMGGALSCDGPEDCGGVMSLCCATITGTGGSAMCTATCPGSASMNAGGSINATTKLCHTKNDCVGYTGMVFGSPTPFTSCCTVPQAPTMTFCAPSLITMVGGKCL
jgi:hypothetical protein